MKIPPESPVRPPARDSGPASAATQKPGDILTSFKKVPSPPKVAEVDPYASLTLVVGWRSGPKLKVQQIPVTDDVAGELGRVVESVLHDLESREPERWSAEAIVERETYLRLPVADLGDKPTLARDVEEHGALVDALRAAAALPALGAGKVPAADLLFYAMVVGDDATNRSVFIRRANPRRSLKGKMMTAFRGEALARVDGPVFGFDEDVDLVVVDDEMLVLSQTAFAQLFRDQQALRALVPAWSKVLSDALPFADGAVDALVEKVLNDSRLRSRLESAATRPLPTMAALRKAMEDSDIDPEDHIEDGKLVVTPTSVRDLLQVLNEDYFPGVFSGTLYRADRKTQRT